MKNPLNMVCIAAAPKYYSSEMDLDGIISSQTGTVLWEVWQAVRVREQRYSRHIYSPQTTPKKQTIKEVKLARPNLFIMV